MVLPMRFVASAMEESYVWLKIANVDGLQWQICHSVIT